jgi:hypothetical protein
MATPAPPCQSRVMHGGVFVCHASADAAMAQRAVEVLEAAGVSCWIAPRDIEPGENYTQAILDALDDAPAVVLVFSSATNESPHVTRELETAVGAGKRIIPVRLEDVEPTRALRYFIGTSQWLDASDPADAWSSPSLVRAVRRAIGEPELQPRAAAQARPAAASAPRPASPPGPTPTPGDGTGRSPWTSRSAILVGAGLVAAVVVAVVVAVSLAGGGDPSSADSESTRTSTPQQTGPAAAGRTAATVHATGPVTCWDGSTADGAVKCPTPTGRAGMATVFPGLDDACTQVASPIEGKAEVYECAHNGFIVRYTRWDEGYDKERYYDIENQVPSQAWQVNSQDAGLQWFSIETDPEEEQPYQWSAAYAGLPFSLSVEGETESDRSAGLAQLDLVPPDEVGLTHGS